MAQELTVMEQLERTGLTPVTDTEGLAWDMLNVLPEDAWLFPGAGHVGALEVNSPERWLSLYPRFEAEHFQVEYTPSFPYEILNGPVHWYGSALEGTHHHSFELEIGIQVEGKKYNLLPAVAKALAEHQFSLDPVADEPSNMVWYAPLDARRRVAVNLQQLRLLLVPLTEYLEKPDRRWHLPRVQAGLLDELAEAFPRDAKWHASKALSGFTKKLRSAASRASDDEPEGLAAELRPYQREGLRWLNTLAAAGVGGILADDMGLGKTLQLIAHLLCLKQQDMLQKPVLIVVPTSLISNWFSELSRFAPQLKVLILYGLHRGGGFAQISTHDVVLTSYALLPRDVTRLRRHTFSLLVLDEAQQVKNPRTQSRRAVCEMRAPRCICLTGTPLENHLGELWSQIDLVVPGLLGDEETFRRHVRVPIEKHDDKARQDRLTRRLQPFILRRTKVQVASDLPSKTEIIQRVVMNERQRELYEHVRLKLKDELGALIARRGIKRSGIAVFDTLLKLRQICCDPRLIKWDVEKRSTCKSAKFDLLMEMLDELLVEGRRVLVFSQFTEMLKLIGHALDQRYISYVSLTGQTRDRAAPVQRFQRGEVPLFLLSLKAGGVGLNLTAADTVIHYDPWWNPSAEAQASDRAHRIGQDKPVFVFRLITAGTVEERIEAMKARKAELAESVFAAGATGSVSFDESDLEMLLAPM